MIDGNIVDFINVLYYGGEILFEYRGMDYFIQGWVKDGVSTMVLDNLTLHPKDRYVWDCSGSSMRECAEQFLNTPIWDGKAFLDIESEVRWKDF